MNISWIWFLLAPIFSGLMGGMIPTPSQLLPHRVAWAFLMACVTIALALPMQYKELNIPGFAEQMHILAIVLNIIVMSGFYCVLDYFRPQIVLATGTPSTVPLSLNIQKSIKITNRAAGACVALSYGVLITNVILSS